MATSVVNPRVQFFANNGRPLIGGRIHTYVAGSSTRARTYKDAAKAQPNTNPIVLDGRGETQIYLAEGVEYKFVVEDSKGALIYTQEPVYGAIWPNAEQWPSDAALAYQYMLDAKAAADSIGAIQFYDTYAQAMGDVANWPTEGLIEIARDETHDGARTRYRPNGLALDFVVNLDQLRIDLGSETGANLVSTEFSPGFQRKISEKLREYVTPKDFGAIGDGVLHPLSERFATLADAQSIYPFATSLTQSIDWAAIQYAANSNHRKILISQGDYVINYPVVSSVARKEFCGAGGKISAKNFTGTMLTLDGDSSAVRNLELDGNNESRCGIRFTGASVNISGNRLENFHSSTTSAIAIEAHTYKGCSITGNFIDNVFSEPNGIVGDSPGASRAIELYSNQDAVAPSLIDGNLISNILGEEGDSIQVIFYDGVSTPFKDSKAQVSNNTITEFSRRGIKVQADNTDVICNTLRVFGAYSHPGYCINIISSSNCTVKSNTVRSSMPCVSSSGGSAYTNQNNSIIGNDFTILNNSAVCSFNDYNSGLVYRGNTFTGGTSGLTSQNTANSEYSFNTFRGGASGSGQAIQIFGGSTGRNIINGNQSFGNWSWCVNFTGVNNVVKDNFSIGQCVRSAVGNTNSVISGNIAADNVAAFGDFSGQTLFDNQRLSGGVSGSNGLGVGHVFYSTDNPTTVNPSKWYSKGDFAINANPTPTDKILGWICTTSTTASTSALWRTVISA